MNFYDPFIYSNPGFNMMSITPPRVGLFQRLLGSGFNFSSILNGTQKTLNIVNQAIPLIQQAKPMVSNAKTMFQVMNEFKKIDVKDNKPKKTPKVNNIQKKEPTIINDQVGPMFFQ